MRKGALVSVEDLMYGCEQLEEARPFYEEADRFYAGTQAEAFASPRIARLVRNSTGKIRTNFANVPVDVVVDRLEINSIVGADDAATQLWQRVWDDNLLGLEAPEIHRTAGKYGDAYVIAWEGVEEGQVDVHLNDPLTTRIIYDAENPRVKAYAIKRWGVQGKRVRVNLYYPDHIEKWVTKEGTKGTHDADWQPFELPGEAWPLPNPHGVVPVFHFRTGRPYGDPDHERAYGPQRGIDKLVASMAAGIDFNVVPQRWALEEPHGDLDADDLYDDDGADKVVKGEQAVSQLKAGAGTMWLLQNIKSVGQFEPMNPENLLAPITFFVKSMATATRVPVEEFDTGGDQPSGESRRRREAPLVKRVRSRQLSYGSTWQELSEFALSLLGVNADMTVNWGAISSVDDLEGMEVADTKQRLGVPQHQTLLELGYTADQIEEWGDDIDESELKRRIELLASLGQAVQGLGAGAALGVIDAGQVKAAVDKLLDVTSGDDDGENASTGGE
jgi:hypothetical protein